MATSAITPTWGASGRLSLSPARRGAPRMRWPQRSCSTTASTNSWPSGALMREFKDEFLHDVSPFDV